MDRQAFSATGSQMMTRAQSMQDIRLDNNSQNQLYLSALDASPEGNGHQTFKASPGTAKNLGLTCKL